MTDLEREIMQVLRDRGPIGILGLEDHCDAWRTPRELREALGYLVVEGLAERAEHALDPQHVELVTYALTCAGMDSMMRAETSALLRQKLGLAVTP